MSAVNVRLYARIGNSEVFNDLGGVDAEAGLEPITDETRRETDAPDATTRIFGLDMPAVLRQLADQIEAGS